MWSKQLAQHVGIEKFAPNNSIHSPRLEAILHLSIAGLFRGPHTDTSTAFNDLSRLSS
jgi:hypothetical protein